RDLACALGIAPGLEVPHLGDLVLEPRHVALEGAAPESDERERDGGASHCGATRASPPAVISHSSRRFCAHADSSEPWASGRSSPNEMTSIRPASTPLFTR